MNLEDLFEARLAGEQPEVPEALDDNLKHALAAHEALQFALGETILLPASEADDRTPPSLPADYEIVRELGRGGMGVVYLARQKSLDRLVAVKVLRPGEMAFGPMVRRFLDEAKHLARLRHPNLVSVHEVGEAGGEPYFSMDYIDGESLADLLRRERSSVGNALRGIPGVGKRRRFAVRGTPRRAFPTDGIAPHAFATQRGLSPSRALAMLKQAAEGVAHAHEIGIIHRDLKPANILIDAAGRAYVTDFGLARNLTDESDRTHSGAVIGTPQYMSPEQARGETRLVGETTDVHALGAVLYEMLTGRPPYGSDNPMQVLMRLVHEEPTPPRRIDPRISRDLETICLKALAKQPTARYATVRAMLEDIHRYETGQPLMARRPGIGHRAKRLVRRYGKVALVASVAASLVAGAFIVLAPKPSDKSVEEFVNWGESEHAAGNHVQAVHIFHRAFQRADPTQRSELKLLGRMERCVAELDNPREAVDAALEILDDFPDASFGKYNFELAQALVTRLNSRYPQWRQSSQINPDGTVRPNVDDRARPLMQLVEKRLAIAVKGLPDAAAERAQCQEQLALFRKQLEGRAHPSSGAAALRHSASAAEGLHEPATTPAALLASAADESLSTEVRLQAAYEAGQRLEKSGDTGAAKAAYLKAYSFRADFPFYALRPADDDLSMGSAGGTAKPQPFSGSMADLLGDLVRKGEEAGFWFEPEACRALGGAYAALKRLDGDNQLPADDLRGGLRIGCDGLKPPPELRIKAQLRLRPAAEARQVPNAGAIMVPLTSPPALVGVADGRYRLTCDSSTRQFPGDREDLAWLSEIELDVSRLPAEVEIQGNTLDLPPIRLHLPAEIKALAPTADASVDLQEQIFRWAEVAHAVKYQVLFVLEMTKDGAYGPGRHIRSLSAIETTSTSLCLPFAPREDLNALSHEPLRGRIIVWSVSANDANNATIGKTYKGGVRCLVTRGLQVNGE